ncbi:TolC family protein, partial [Staphylococcus sp. SIMBA_130]
LKDQALQSFLATTAAKDATQISLISNIAQSYANLSYSLAQLQLAEATVQSREQSLFIASKRFEAGIDPKLPSLQASASLENAKLAVLR